VAAWLGSAACVPGRRAECGAQLSLIVAVRRAAASARAGACDVRTWSAASAPPTAAPARRLPAAEVQARALRPGRAGADAAADGARTGAFLGGLFAHVCGAGAAALAANPWLAAAAARLVGDYAAWLGGPGVGARALPRRRGHALAGRVCMRQVVCPQSGPCIFIWIFCCVATASRSSAQHSP